MSRQWVLAVGGLIAIAACAQNARVESSGEVAPATPVNSNSVPSGTAMHVKLNESLGTMSSHEGDHFSATLSDPVMAQSGTTVVPAGAVVYGRVTGIHSPTLPTEQAVIRLAFDSLNFNGRSYPFDASISSVNVQNQATNPTTGTTVRGAVTGAAAGAVLGAIISGGDLGKIISGGLLGAAAGTVISLGMGGTQSAIPAGSSMTIRSTQTVQIR
ncbi:MAG: hypothetical protein ACM37U_07295 [Gemmatimonas sp.]|nr:hypothetical protein [Gemmatimonadaceae bacterium]